MSLRVSYRVIPTFSLLFLLGMGILSAADAPLPEGVKAVWDLAKASHETTTTRERICINGLWRWQPILTLKKDEKVGEAVLPSDNWGFMKVPGAWPGSNDYRSSDAQRVYPHSAWADADLTATKFAWYQREISVPASWTDRDILLELNWVQSSADILIDGHALGNIPYPGGKLDITTACKPGQKQMLSIWMSTAPLSKEMTSYSNFDVSSTVKASVKRRGLCGDAYLEGVPAKARIADVTISPSVRKWELGIDAELPKLAPDQSYKLKGEVFDGEKKVHSFESAPFKAANLVEGRFAFATPWKPEKLWDSITPGNIYVLRLALLSDKGQLADAFQDVRFGFRELWIDGKDFRLNGTRVHFNAVQYTGSHRSVFNVSYAGAKESFLRYRESNFNLAYDTSYNPLPGESLGWEDVLRAADDTGMLFSFALPNTGNYRKWVPETKTHDLIKEAYSAHVAYYVKQARNHPAVVFYSMNHNMFGHYEEHNPQTLHTLPDFAFDKTTGKRVDPGQESEDIVRRFDSSRVIYHHGGVLAGSVISPNVYLNNTPIQEVSDWFATWAEKGDKPLLVVEFCAPLEFDFTFFRGYPLDKNGNVIPGDLVDKTGKVVPGVKGERKNAHYAGTALWTEFQMPGFGAQLRGDKAYQLSDQECANLRFEAKTWHGDKPMHHYDFPINCNSAEFHAANLRETQALYDTENWPAFRALGVSGVCNWTMGEIFVMKPNVNQGKPVVMRDGSKGKIPSLPLPTDWDHLQMPGYSPDWENAPDQYMQEACGGGQPYCHRREDWVPQPILGPAWLRVTRPTLAYIGGKESHITGMDHNFHPGESVEKQIFVINDSRKPVKATCEWSLPLPTPIHETKEVTVETGEQARLPLRVALPADLPSGDYDISLTATFDTGEVQKDTFAIHVLPRSGIKVAAAVSLFDPMGQTKDTLEAMGVKVSLMGAEAKPDPKSILVIGKNALTVDGAGPDLSAVRDGLRVVVFEQTAEALEQRLGFRVQEYRLGNVFPRIPDHPLLAGIKPQNLWNWRGSSGSALSSLVSCFYNSGWLRPNGNFTKWCGLTEFRIWRCSDYGAVASVLIERPACGDFLPLLEGGFSLQYAPLMEYREGKGMVLFCQMDVTKRGDTDPAAETIIKNAVEYAAAWKPAPERHTWYAGEAAGKAHLEKSGLTIQNFEGAALSQDDVLIAGPGAGKILAEHSPGIADWLAKGGNLLLIGLSDEDANGFLPFKVTMETKEHISTYFPPPSSTSLLAGASPAGVHSREPRQFNLLLASDTVEILGNGVLAQANKAHVVFCQIVPWKYDYKDMHNLKTTFRYSSGLLSRLLGNMGVRAATPLLARFSDPAPKVDLAGTWKRVFSSEVNTPKDPSLNLDPKARWRVGLYLDLPVEGDDPYRFYCW